MIRTKIRFLTISLLVGVLFLLVIYAYFTLKEVNWNEIEVKQIITLFGISFFVIVITTLLYKPSVVSFDEDRKKLKIRNSIFSFKNNEYHLNEIDSFRFIRLKGKISIKGIEIKTKKGRKFAIYGFVIKNLKEFENVFLKYLELKSGKGFNGLSEKGKNREVLENKRFEKEQQDETKNYMYLTTGISLVFLTILIYFNNSLNNGFIALALLFAFIISISIIKLIKINKSV